MTRSRIPTQAELDAALWLDGSEAIEVAEAAHGAPSWPPLLQLLAAGGWREVSLVDAQADCDAGWPLDMYMYPVPRARVERGLDRAAGLAARCEIVRSALRGDAEALHRVAIELALADRKAVAS